jgi:hypothetical protein
MKAEPGAAFFHGKETFRGFYEIGHETDIGGDRRRRGTSGERNA